jgi:hypothetical protein
MNITRASGGDRTQSEFRLVFAVAFTIFFVAIALSRLLPRRFRFTVSGHAEERSIAAAARHAAYNSIPFAFM